jgi:hypothetical protein
MSASKAQGHRRRPMAQSASGIVTGVPFPKPTGLPSVFFRPSLLFFLRAKSLLQENTGPTARPSAWERGGSDPVPESIAPVGRYAQGRSFGSCPVAINPVPICPVPAHRFDPHFAARNQSRPDFLAPKSCQRVSSGWHWRLCPQVSSCDSRKRPTGGQAASATQHERRTWRAPCPGAPVDSTGRPRKSTGTQQQIVRLVPLSSAST